MSRYDPSWDRGPELALDYMGQDNSLESVMVGVCGLIVLLVVAYFSDKNEKFDSQLKSLWMLAIVVSGIAMFCAFYSLIIWYGFSLLGIKISFSLAFFIAVIFQSIYIFKDRFIGNDN